MANDTDIVREDGTEQEPAFCIAEIEGSIQQLHSLKANPGMILSRGSAQLLEGGRGRISGYVTDEAVSMILQSGCAVRVVQTKEDLARHEAVVARQVDGNECTSLIEITSALEDLRRLIVIPGVRLEAHHAEELDEGQWKVSAEVTAEALQEIRAGGYAVTIMVPEEEMLERRHRFFGIEDDLT